MSFEKRSYQNIKKKIQTCVSISLLYSRLISGKLTGNYRTLTENS